MPIILPADIESYIGIPPVADTKRITIAKLIASSQTEIESFLNQNILATESGVPQYVNPKVRIEDGNDRTTFPLRFFPLVYATTADFVLELRAGLGLAWTVIDPSLYEIESGAGGKAPLVYYPDGFIPLKRNYRMTYKSGYASVDVMPQDIQNVAVEMTVMKAFRGKILSNVNDSRLGLQSASDSRLQVSGSTSFLDLRPEWKERLTPYRVTLF